VDVYGNGDYSSKTGGNLYYSSSFTRTIKSDSMGELYLHIQVRKELL
jgi:hypothetical protein